VASARDEHPLYLPAGRENVFAIVTRPSGPANDVAVLCLHAGARNLTSHRNRMFTRLCREVAGAGCLAMRMDYHGTGDSTGVLADRGIFGQTVDDVSAAVRWLTEQGARRIVAVGTCWGGLVALVVAAQQEAIVSACLLSPPLALLETGAGATERRTRQEDLGRALSRGLRPHVIKLLVVEREYRRWLLGRIRRRAARVSAQALGRTTRSPSHAGDERPSPRTLLPPLVRRGVPLRVLYGEQDQTYLDLVQLGGPSSFEAARAILDITVDPTSIHGFTTLRAQEVALKHVRTTLARDAGVPVLAPSPGGGALPPADDDLGEVAR
jgi:pimeloyl-ACP methyl ester carboxylesterase